SGEARGMGGVLGNRVGPGEQPAGALEPVFGEHRLQPVDDAPRYGDDAVAPRRWIAARPVIGDSRATDESRSTIDDEQVAVRATVPPAQRLPAEWMVSMDLAAGCVEITERPARRLITADCIDYHTHEDTRPRAFGQRFDERRSVS